MTANAAAHVPPGSPLDFAALMRGVRALKPACLDCSVPLDIVETGIRTRQNDAGGSESVCRACALPELGDRLLEDLPQ